MTTILIKKKDTAGAPAPGDLTNAAGGTEIAVNTATKRIYTKDAAGNVVELGTNASASTIADLTVTNSLTVSGTVTSSLKFTDNTYDIGASGATRPRNYFGAGNITIGQGGTGTSLTPRLTFNGSSASSSSSGIVSLRNSSNNWFIGDNEAVGGTPGLINYIYGANPWSLAIGGSEIIYANGAGTGVGIFQNNPSARLHVSGAASTTRPAFLVESSGTLASNDIIRFSIVGLTNGFRMRQNASSAVRYSFEGGNVGVNLIEPRSAVSVSGNVGLDGGGVLNNLYYDGNWRYSQNSSGIGWYMAGNTNQLYWGTAPANGTQDAIASTSDRMYLQSDGLFQLSSGPTWVAGGFPGMLGKQLCMGYDIANSIGYLRSTNNGTTGTPLYLDGSRIQINTGTTTSVELARFITTGLTFAGSSDIKTAAGFLNISAASTLVLDTGSGTAITFRRGGSDIGYWDGNGLSIGAVTAPSKLTITGGNASLGANAGWLNNLFYDGNWKSIENGWGAGSYTDSAGLWHFISTAASGASYGSVATVQDTMQLAYGKSVALAGSVPQTGTGITFPASQNPSTNANTLDDYEEGSFTPVWSATGGGLTPTYFEQVGIYIKIGRMVYFRFRLVTGGSTGGTGNLRFGGLPFTQVNNGSPGFTSLNFTYGWAGNAVLAMVCVGNSTEFDCYTQYGAFNSNTQTPAGSLAGATVYFIGGGCYEAAN